MTETELIFMTLAELSTRQIAENVNAAGCDSFWKVKTVSFDTAGRGSSPRGRYATCVAQ
jgi:hypothetical protein